MQCSVRYRQSGDSCGEEQQVRSGAEIEREIFIYEKAAAAVDER